MNCEIATWPSYGEVAERGFRGYNTARSSSLKASRLSIQLTGCLGTLDYWKRTATKMTTGQELREKITKSLTDQGFTIHGGNISLSDELTKGRLREAHQDAVQHRIDARKKSLARHEDRLLTRLARSSEVHPELIAPRLVQVVSGTEDELLFRYACLHWSIPVSSGYGRRLRFLIIDDSNGKLMGVIGLGDPVFSLGDRDRWIGWTRDSCGERLNHVMDAFALGAVPPYSKLLCGKLVAMLAASNEVRHAFQKKYGGRESLISQKTLDAQLAMITTTSALGRSSVYNRIRLERRALYLSVGFTRGYGEFQFTNGLYGAISQYAAEHCKATAKQTNWGTGFRNRREVIKKSLSHLGLSTEWLYHGVHREIFVVPLASNSREYLCGLDTELRPHDQPMSTLCEFFRRRWLLPRAAWDKSYQAWDPQEWKLW